MEGRPEGGRPFCLCHSGFINRADNRAHNCFLKEGKNMLSGISLWQLLIVLAIVVMLFGTKRIRSLGSDLGGAFKGFRDAVKDGESSLEGNQKNADSLASSGFEKSKDSVRS